MTIVRPLAFFGQPDMTLVVYDNNIPRWIYTDGREMPKDAEPSYAGYSIGKWLDTDGDGRFDTLEVETKNFKGPRIYDDSGIPLHHDNESVIKERLSLDKSNPNILLNEITTYDHALTRPWTVTKHYQRVPGKVEFHEDLCLLGQRRRLSDADQEGPGAARPALFQADAEVITPSPACGGGSGRGPCSESVPWNWPPP